MSAGAKLAVDLSYLRYFYAVARSGGFSKASKLLHVQQPSITRGVQRLEASLGLRLIERQKNRISLTSAGRDAFAVCERIFAEAENFNAIVDAENGVCRGVLKFAAANPISTELVPRFLADYAGRYPQVWPQFVTGTASDLNLRISSADLDFGLFYYAPQLPAGLESRPLAETRFRLVVAAGSAKDRAVVSRFIGSREIEDLGARRLPTLARLKKDVPAARLAISTNDIAAHLGMVKAGLGVSVLPDFLVAPGLRAGELVDLYPREERRFPLLLVSRKNAVHSRATRVFIEEFAAWLAKPAG